MKWSSLKLSVHHLLTKNGDFNDIVLDIKLGPNAKGIPASKICVNPTFQIVPEKTDIKTIYGEFKNWIADPRII